MMELRITPAASNDLKDIKEYISQNLCNPTAAVRVVKNIINSYLRLTDTPYLGAQLSQKIDVNTPFRYIISGNYLIFYQIANDIIEIHRIIYARRDYIKILFNNNQQFNNLSENAPE